jgi:hypothetical protein
VSQPFHGCGFFFFAFLTVSAVAPALVMIPLRMELAELIFALAFPT